MSLDQYILVIEDDIPLRDLYRSALRGAGYTVICVGDGVEALNLVEQQVPRAVILDLSLPRLDGRAVHRLLSSHLATRHVPIIVVTGSDISDLNLDDFAYVLRKPLTVESLIAAVDSCLRRVI
jgi:two-component system alkaline phosphatase synthesis response regulator PhoP